VQYNSLNQESKVESPGDQWIGTRIREYEILERIGHGGMGSVYRARHIYLDEERAIKLIQTQLAESQDFVNRFIREAKILAKLRHPNLVQLYEFGTLEDNRFFMVLEFLQGESVLQRIQKIQRIPIQHALRIIREAAMGLAAGHQKGIIHRDLSPDNLFLVQTESGVETTKVIDFGIARPTAKETQRFTRTNMFIGKLEYVSPELCGQLSEDEELDQRADIYSLGVTLYHMLTGRLPFSSNTPQGFMYKHLNENARPLSSHVDCGPFPPELDRFIAKAMAKLRENRHASMKEVVDHLNQIESSLTPTVQAMGWTAPALPTAGSLFANRYLIEKRIGEGGMGTVFKATDRMLDISVAIKALNRELVSNETNLNRLKREVILARKVAHPNVCRLYDIGEAGGVHYVSMEFVEGQTLSEILHRQGSLPEQQAIGIMRQVLTALSAAHSQGIVHRDLKPQNIMIDRTGRAMMMDFGISFSAEAGHLTQTGMMVGTPRYMAPEQFKEQGSDQRSDLYSAGIILYEIVTGRVPFDARTPASMMYAHLNTPPPRPSQFCHVSPQLESIILKALEKDPSKRFQSTQEFMSAFDQPIIPVAPPPVPLEPELIQEYVEPESKSYVGWIAVFFFLLLGGAAAAYYFLIYRQPPLVVQQSVPSNTDQPATQSSPTQTQLVSETPLSSTFESDAPNPNLQTQDTIAQPVVRHFTVRSRPDGASIFINQQDTGLKTPADLELQTGQLHQLELRMPEYQPASFTINDETSDLPVLDLTAIPVKPGNLVYQGEFPVSIFLNKSRLFNSDEKDSSGLKPGSYQVVIISNSIQEVYIRYTQRVEISSGETTIIKDPPMAQLTLTAQPSNCILFIEGEQIDTAPIFKYPIQAGQKQIRVLWDKLGKEKTVRFNFSAGTEKTLHAIIENDSAQLFEE
jgi:eukaryotic-like serine/threonine-protein kinase